MERARSQGPQGKAWGRACSSLTRYSRSMIIVWSSPSNPQMRPSTWTTLSGWASSAPMPWPPGMPTSIGTADDHTPARSAQRSTSTLTSRLRVRQPLGSAAGSAAPGAEVTSPPNPRSLNDTRQPTNAANRCSSPSRRGSKNATSSSKLRPTSQSRGGLAATPAGRSSPSCAGRPGISRHSTACERPRERTRPYGDDDRPREAHAHTLRRRRSSECSAPDIALGTGTLVFIFVIRWAVPRNDENEDERPHVVALLRQDRR